MKLPGLSLFKKPVPKEYFLALLLRDEHLHAVVFEENNSIIHTLGEDKTPLPVPLDDASFEELLAAADKAISTAESALPDNAQSHKTIFGVKENWTKDLQIDKNHLATLKKLCEELDLQPIGFLVFAEAIAHLLQKEEGAPVSGVLVELGEKHITATLLRAGRVVTSKQTLTEDNLPKAVDALLMQFTDIEILPSRIILLDTLHRAHVGQQFTNHTWNKQLPFLHMPQVTPLPDGFMTKAILFGTATQMGFDMLGLPAVTETTEKPAFTEDTEKSTETQSEEAVIANEVVPESEEPRSSAESLGFIKDQDVLESVPKKPIAFDNLKSPDDETPEEFADEAFANIPEEVKENEEGLHSRLPGLGENAVQITEGMQKVLKTLRNVPLASFLAPLKKLPSLIQSTSSTSPLSKKLIVITPVILLLFIGSILWYIFGVKATAILYINPKNVTTSQGITFSSTGGTDVNSDTIGASAVPITENGTVSTQATGSQDVGDEAKGTVTIYNSDTDSHTVSAGTTIVSSNGLKFTTDTDITVASASGDIFSGTQPGTKNVSVTAADIGPAYNLPSGTKFAIGSSSVIAAKNDTAFSGGTKKTVTVVSQQDLDKLTSDLAKNLGDKAKQDVEQHIESGKVVLSTFLSTDTSSQKFDHKAGDQASSVSLSATITYHALNYSKSDLDKVALAIIQSSNQSESISQDTVSEDIQNPTVSTDTTSINATLHVKAGLLPQVDTTKIATELAGKPFTKALDTLSDVPQLNSVHAVLSPNLFFLPKTFPRISSHITVGIKANE